MDAPIDHVFYMTTYRGTELQKVSNRRAGAPPSKIRKVEELNVKVTLEELGKEGPLLCRENPSISTFQKQTDAGCIDSENDQTLKEFLQGVKLKKSKKPLACVVRSAPPVEDYSAKALVPGKKRKRKRLRSTGELYSHAKLLDLTQEKDETLDEWLKRTNGNSRKSGSKDDNRDVRFFERRKVRVNSLEGRKVKLAATEVGGVGPSMGIYDTQSSTKLQKSSVDIPSDLEENEPQIFSYKGLRTLPSSILDVQEAVTELKIPTLQSDRAPQSALRGEEVTQDMCIEPEASEVIKAHLEDLALRSKPSHQCVNVTAPSDVPFLQKHGDEQPRRASVTQIGEGTEMGLDAHIQLETVIGADLSDAPIMHPVSTETLSKGVEEQLLVVLESDSSEPSDISSLAAIPSALDVCSSAKWSSDNGNFSPKQRIIWEPRLKSASVGVSSWNDMRSDKERIDGDAQGECIPCSEYDGKQDDLSLLTSINSKNSMGEISPSVDIVEEELTVLEDKESNISTEMSESVTSVTPNSIASRGFVDNYSSEACKSGPAILPNLQPRCTVSDVEAPGQGDSASHFLAGSTSCCDDSIFSLPRKSRKKRKVKDRKAISLDTCSQGGADIHLKVNEDCTSNTLRTLSPEELPVLLEEGFHLGKGHEINYSQEMSDRDGGVAELHNGITLNVNKCSTVSSEEDKMCQERDSLIDNSIIEGQTFKKAEMRYSCLANLERVRDDFEAEDILSSEKMVMELSPEIGSLVKSFTFTDFSEYSPEATQDNDLTGEGAQEECWNEVTTCSSSAETNEGFQGVDGGDHATTEFLGSSGMKSVGEKGQCPNSPLLGLSKMPCKRKAISPRSQQELLRASRPQSRRIPFRIKLLKSFSKYEGADRHSRSKEGSQNFVLGNDDMNFSFGDSFSFSESQDDLDHTERDGEQSASLSPISLPFCPPLQLTQNDPSSLTTIFSKDPVETISCSNEQVPVGSPEHNKLHTSHSTDIQHVLLQTIEESSVKLISFQESPNCSQLPISSGSPHTPVKIQETPQQIRSILKTSSLKCNIGVVPCQGSCKCPKCITLCGHSKTAIEFIASQMSFADRIAGRLIAEMTNMCNIMEDEHRSGGEGEQSNSSPTPKKVALESAAKAQEWARKELLKMSRDSKRVCRLIDTGPRRIIFADEAGRRLCHAKFLPGKKTAEDSQSLA